MDASLYKTLTTSRGVQYNYYSSPAQPGKLTLLFCHGFPSTSVDWRYFVPFFKSRGYGIVVPDLLGYGETDKPTDAAMYVSSKVCRDVVDILDAEGVKKAIAIGHDWGAKTVSRLGNYYPERFIAYAFLAVPYVTPHSFSNYEQLLAAMRATNGYDTFGYWTFFASDEADTIMRGHIDSLVTLLFPQDPMTGKTTIAPTGALKEHLLKDYKGPLASYIHLIDVEGWKKIFMKNGFAAPTSWYKIMINGMEGEDDKQIPSERAYPPKDAPIFFGAARDDVVCVPENGYALFKSEGFKEHDVTSREFAADHWLVFTKADEICREVESWIQGKGVDKAKM